MLVLLALELTLLRLWKLPWDQEVQRHKKPELRPMEYPWTLSLLHNTMAADRIFHFQLVTPPLQGECEEGRGWTLPA